MSYQKLSKDQLITKLLEVESERNNLVSLYLTADSLLKDSTAYITYLLSSRVELEEELINLKENIKIPFSVKEEFEKIRAELREMENQK